MKTRTHVQVLDLGLVDYARAWDMQKACMEDVRSGRADGVVMLLEHPHVYTLGRRGKDTDVLLDEAALKSLGVHVHQIDRGGEATYHGPGQLVAYPILDLRQWGGGPVKYVRALEEALVRTLSDRGIAGRREDRLPGVWVGQEKIAFVGVRISGGITCHGISLNVNSDLSFYGHIVPCGIADLRVISVERLTGAPTDMAAVKRAFVRHLGDVMGLDMDWPSSP